MKEPSAAGPLTPTSYCNVYDHASPAARRALAAQVYLDHQNYPGTDAQVTNVEGQLDGGCTNTLIRLPVVTATITYVPVGSSPGAPSDDGSEDDSGGVTQTTAPTSGTASVTNYNGFTFTVTESRVAYSQNATDLGYGLPEIWGTLTNTEDQNGLPPRYLGAALTTAAYAKLRVTTAEGGPNLPPDDSLNPGPCVHPSGQPGWCVFETAFFDTESLYATTEYGYTDQDPINAHASQTFICPPNGFQELPVSVDLASNIALIYANQPLPASQAADTSTIAWTLIR